MKKEKDYAIPLLIALFLFACLCSCNTTLKISGPIQEIRGDTLIGINHSFVVKDAYKWKVGDSLTFTSTTNRRKINSKKVN